MAASAGSIPSYVAPGWLPNRHLMTIYASVARLPERLPIARERWELPDGDFLDVDRLAGPRPDAPLLLVLHGLEGSSRSGYVRGLLARARARGLAGLALNFRGCSGEPNRLARFYHSGDTGDLAHALERLTSEQPGRPIVLAGFSLGGNVVAKFLGERGEDLPGELKAASVVSVPFDLLACSRALDGPGLPAWIYRQRFLRKLRAKSLAKARRFPGAFDLPRLRAARLLRDFDDAVTAPLHGFASAEDYYARSSSGRLLDGVARPLQILAAEDDPFIPTEALPLAAAKTNPRIQLEVSHAGGHVGFVDGPPWRPRRFAEERAAAWLAEKVAC
jgi:hypothetical protein